MKTIFDHIDAVKRKPHHVRKHVAFTAAALGTALIALVWLVGSVSTGAFAINGSSFNGAGAVPPVVATGGTGDTTGVAGVAAVLSGAQVPAHIEIVDTASSTGAKAKVQPTTIPF